jgi:DNA-binding transcriptional regulator LsrR (DeoR family)
LSSDSILGISWGTALFSTAQALRPKRPLPITVVQMIGAVGTDNPLIDGPDLARFLANIYGGQYRYMHAPLVVENQDVRVALLQEPRIKETLDYARRADVALVGIGSLIPEVSSLLRAGYLNRQELADLREIGVSGDICAQHYDANGNVMDIDMNDCVVGISLDALGSIERVIGVACGEQKAEAILGALRGGHINVLITDDSACRKLIVLNGERETISAMQREEEVESGNH